MISKTPIYDIAKELNIESNRIILACKKLGIEAKGSTKKLNKEEIDKVKNYFETGKNVSEEIVEINKVQEKSIPETKTIQKKVKVNYFANRLIGKS